MWMGVRAIPARPGAPGAAWRGRRGGAGAAAAPGGIPSGIEARLPGLNASLLAKDGIWQIVSGTRFKFFVFSAFYDRREVRTVRIIAATKTRGPDRVWCRLWYNGSAPGPGPAHAQGNASTASSAAKPYSVTVAAKVKKLAAPSAVSVVSWLRLPPANLLVVRNTDADLAARNLTAGPLGGDPPPQPAPNPKASAANAAPPVSSVAHVPDTIAVCVKPLHFNYNQHFTLYNHTLGAQVSCVLRDYMARGVVTLLPWQLNMLSQKEIRTEGLFAALNDCLYRSMYQYAYTALIDLDEYIIPRNHDTLPELVKWMGTRMNTRGTGSYSFQNAFFYLQWEDDAGLGEADRLESGLVTLRKTRRRLKLHPHKQRSKYLCRPEFIVEAGNHFVWEFVPGHGTLNVPPDAAILHHYRVCEFGGDDCIKTASVVDKTAYRYRERSGQRVRQRLTELQLLLATCRRWWTNAAQRRAPTPAAPAAPRAANDSHDHDDHKPNAAAS
ncbi:Uncharacterized protein GBIM_01512 [Gryllus bimaculatus]|nr:Uncharacterized protein GBIM_01512 [Gryllus bimaculatus]